MNKTNIEYTDYSWNVAPGCTMVNDGCVHCWAMTMAKRLKAMGKPEYQDLTDERGRWTGQIALLSDRLNEPLQMKKPRKIVVNFMGDLFHPEVPDSFIASVFEVMRRANWHTFYVLTKRPQWVPQTLETIKPFGNVLIGTSIVSDKWAFEWWDPMQALSERGWRTWVSYEPALGPVQWEGWEFLDFMTAGGESGTGARKTHPSWIRMAREFCLKHEIKFFFKQWGEWAPVDQLDWVTDETRFSNKPVNHYGTMMVRVGKGRAGRMLDGREWRELPE